jgi:hypothetical protein
MKVPLWNLLSVRERKITLWIFGMLLFYALIGFLILPPIIRNVAVKQLTRQLGRDVSIAQVKINPFVLSATVDGLLIKDTNGEPFVSWDEVYVNFQLSSFFGKAWVFKEISTTKPFVSVRMNRDGSFNFSDILAKFSANAAPAATAPKSPGEPLILHVDRLHIGRASAALADFTTREPFRRVVGPLDITLDNFRTDPDNKNPYAFSGTTDAGEMISWSGFFYLDPLRSEGELKLFNFTLNKYAPLYQDLVRFQIRDGSIALDTKYRLALSATNRVAVVEDSAFALRDFKLGVAGDSNNIVELPLFDVTGASVDLQNHQAAIGSVFATGGKLFLSRSKTEAINVVELSKPPDAAASAPGGILLLLHSVTNAVAQLLNSTNQWSGTILDVNVTNCALHLEDLVNSRPAKLDLDQITLTAKNISNILGTNLTASLSLRWNTNGSINTKLSASFLPPTADIQLALTNLNLGTLDPYLEPMVNLLILDSRLGLDGQIHLRTPAGGLPAVTFAGNARLDALRTVDGASAEDLLKWDSLRFSGIDANLNPPTVAIKEIAVDQAYARVVIETNKTINLLTALQPAVANVIPATNSVVVSKNPPAPAANTNTLPKISIASIVITNAQLDFTDRSLTPNVHLAIQQASGTIAGISTEDLQHADLNLHALVDNVGPVDITGHINPFSGAQTNQVKISVKNVDLTPASPYAGKFAGYRIARGKLNLDLEYDLVGKKLESKNVITLDQFTFGEKVESPDATHLPVRLAIALLKDRDGKIVLDVPIEGSLDDPKFRIGKVVVRVIENILVKVATSPFSLLGAAFGGGGEEMSYQDFAPGSAELSPDGTKKLDSLLKGLTERPALQLLIAGSVDPVNDHDGLQRAGLDRELRAKKWLLLRQSERATNTVDQVTLTAVERKALVKKLYAEAVAGGKITPAEISANPVLAAIAAQIPSHSNPARKGATLLMNPPEPIAAKPAVVLAPDHLAALADPKEALLLAMTPVTEGDLVTLAADRAKAVRTYLIETGKVDGARLFLTESQTAGVRTDGSRVYLQFQ